MRLHILAAGLAAGLLVSLPAPAGAQALEGLEREIVGLFERASPSVVSISLRREGPQALTSERPRPGDAAGSGIVWDTSGHIVTNAHVLETMAEGRVLAVSFDGMKRLPARVIGMAPEADLAVIRLEVADRPLVPIARGTSAGLRVGQLVFAIGNPFGLDRSLSQGIISALDRKLPTVAGREVAGVIQTDAAINPGNSGGPLLDARGRLIGVNTAILSRSGTSAGIGFSVPVDTVARIVPALIRDGRVPRPGIGVVIAGEDEAEKLGADGVVVLQVAPNTPAARAGLKPLDPESRRLGDVIAAIDGMRVRNVPDLAVAFGRTGVGNRATLEVHRDGQRMMVPVEVIDLNPPGPILPARARSQP
ncbi:MAG: trypsin-like peptidase domain-containing protein [Rhodospirillales bacterium]|nr:trypsin-like peptidase domain-containing protein [Rhodospirillales bacterium]